MLAQSVTRSMLAGLLLAVGVVSAPLAHADPEPTQQRFTALVEAVRLREQLFAEGFKITDQVSVSANAIVYDPPLKFRDVRVAEPAENPAVQTVIDYLRANLMSPADQIAAYWWPSERPALLQRMRQPGAWLKNREQMRAHPGAVILGVIYQDSTVSVLLARGGGAISVTLRRDGGRYFLVSKPDDDWQLAVAEAAFWTPPDPE